MLQISGDDVAAAWVLNLSDLVPTPAKARRQCAAPVETLLRSRRIHRIDADIVLRML